ncbi:MAG: hypothetical protein AAF585_22865 [Verrucomicrobiota bacterium]
MLDPISESNVVIIGVGFSIQNDSVGQIVLQKGTIGADGVITPLADLYSYSQNKPAQTYESGTPNNSPAPQSYVNQHSQNQVLVGLALQASGSEIVALEAKFRTLNQDSFLLANDVANNTSVKTGWTPDYDLSWLS